MKDIIKSLAVHLLIVVSNILICYVIVGENAYFMKYWNAFSLPIFFIFSSIAYIVAGFFLYRKSSKKVYLSTLSIFVLMLALMTCLLVDEEYLLLFVLINPVYIFFLGLGPFKLLQEVLNKYYIIILALSFPTLLLDIGIYLERKLRKSKETTTKRC